MTVAPYVVMPDVILLALSVLNADENVQDALGDLSGRVGTYSPEDASTAWIRLHRIGGVRSLTAPMRLVDATIQVDCFAPASVPNGPLIQGDPGAAALALYAEAALFASAGYSNAAGVIAYVRETQGIQSLPDTSRTPPTPRCLFTVAITARPN